METACAQFQVRNRLGRRCEGLETIAATPSTRMMFSAWLLCRPLPPLPPSQMLLPLQVSATRQQAEAKLLEFRQCSNPLKVCRHILGKTSWPHPVVASYLHLPHFIPLPANTPVLLSRPTPPGLLPFPSLFPLPSPITISSPLPSRPSPLPSSSPASSPRALHRQRGALPGSPDPPRVCGSRLGPPHPRGAIRPAHLPPPLPPLGGRRRGQPGGVSAGSDARPGHQAGMDRAEQAREGSPLPGAPVPLHRWRLCTGLRLRLLGGLFPRLLAVKSDMSEWPGRVGRRACKVHWGWGVGCMRSRKL